MMRVVTDLTTPTIIDLTTPDPPDYDEEADRLAEEQHFDLCAADPVFRCGSHLGSIDEALTLACDADSEVSVS
jgi:hypothetical protein